ncbi:unnamed protein product [Schistosoma bovis]|nr:unnamed protein product [Schistosoma bovis]
MSDILHLDFLLWLCFIKLIYSNHHSTIGIINVDEIDQTFSQTDHYYYTELIRFNQSSPVIFDNMNKPINLSRPRPFMPLFPFIYFGEQFRSVTIFSQGVLGIGPGTEKPDSGNIIHAFDGEDEYVEVQVKDSNEFSAVKWLRLNTQYSNKYQIKDHGICSYSTNRMIKHVPTEESTVKHNIESTNLITLTSNKTTMESITTENISPTQPLMNIDELNKINESSVNDHQTTFPQVTIYQSSSRPIQITTHMIIKVTEDNPITSKQLLFSRDILQIYSITFINEVTRRLYIRLLMPFIIVTIVPSIVFLVWLFRKRH